MPCVVRWCDVARILPAADSTSSPSSSLSVAWKRCAAFDSAANAEAAVPSLLITETTASPVMRQSRPAANSPAFDSASTRPPMPGPALTGAMPRVSVTRCVRPAGM